MKIATHNSLSYAPVKQWYLKPFSWIAKCQSKSIDEQYKKGVRFFDIRLKDHKVAHGIIKYSIVLQDTLKYLDTKNDVIVRVLFEGGDEECFQSECELIETLFPSIKFCGGWDRNNRNRIVYKFKNPEPEYDNEYASYQQYKPDAKWYHRFWAIWPWLYAKLNNKKIKFNDNKYIMVDFI